MRSALGLILLASLGLASFGVEPPTLPVGLDAYRQWERWPYQRIGARAYMRSTYDRRGGNEGADASHFLYQERDDFNVALDVAGAGVLYFVRCNHWHGSPWHYEIDGTDHLVQETATADPVNAKTRFRETTFIPEHLFPHPLVWTWSTTKGADLMWVPLAFEQSFRLAYSRTHYGTGYYIYHLYDPTAPLTRPLRSWDGATPPDRDALDLIARAGQDLAPQPNTPAGRRLGVQELCGDLGLHPKSPAPLTRINSAPGTLRALQFSVPQDQALEFGRARLRVTWDDRPEPSIDAPVALFFGAGTLYNRDGREYLVKGFPVHIRYAAGRVQLACFWPMPFFKSARFELDTAGGVFSNVTWSVRWQPFNDPPAHVGYFHATYRDHPQPEPGRDLILLDTRGLEQHSEWSGSFVGMSWIFSHRAVLTTLEGDPRFFFDDSLTPQAYGTGTEEWGGGGDYWGGRNMTLPFAGHPCGAPSAQAAHNAEDQIESAYRFLLADLMPFGNRAVIRLEHGGENQSTEHYQSVVYWYGAPQATLRLTDTLKIGDPLSEQAHDYQSPDASAPYALTSLYEWGVDPPAQSESESARNRPPPPPHPADYTRFEAHTDRGRQTTGTSEFTLKVSPDNWGVVLRRKLDYAFPNQRAEVFIADADRPSPDWQRAGTWHLAGANTCVYSNPRGELGATQHVVQTSNRRFRDDEFILPRALTRGRERLRVRIRFTPVSRPLFPGQPVPELAWSEIRYDALSWVLPESGPR